MKIALLLVVVLFATLASVNAEESKVAEKLTEVEVSEADDYLKSLPREAVEGEEVVDERVKRSPQGYHSLPKPRPPINPQPRPIRRPPSPTIPRGRRSVENEREEEQQQVVDERVKRSPQGSRPLPKPRPPYRPLPRPIPRPPSPTIPRGRRSVENEREEEQQQVVDERVKRSPQGSRPLPKPRPPYRPLPRPIPRPPSPTIPRGRRSVENEREEEEQQVVDERVKRSPQGSRPLPKPRPPYRPLPRPIPRPPSPTIPRGRRSVENEREEEQQVVDERVKRSPQGSRPLPKQRPPYRPVPRPIPRPPSPKIPRGRR